jgi:pimeloyl-ACP methyl ester carboxylesterase
LGHPAAAPPYYLPMDRLILLSGMGADARVFEHQLTTFSQAICPPWIPPHAGETLTAYAERFAHALRLAISDEPCVLGGASFGGFVAAEMARHLAVRALILVGSVKSPSELPPVIRGSNMLAAAASAMPFSLVRPLCRLIDILPESSVRLRTRQILQQAGDADDSFLKWACIAVMRWQDNTQPIPCPVHHIHGTADRILPIRYTRPTHVVRGGGHVLTMTHPDQVNALIADALR